MAIFKERVVARTLKLTIKTTDMDNNEWFDESILKSPTDM